MRMIKQNPSYIFLTGITMVLVSLVAMQLIVIFNQQALASQISLPVESDFLIMPTQTAETMLATSTPSLTPISAATATSIPPTTEPAVMEVDLRFGVTERGLNCPLMTEIAALVLEEKEDLKAEIISYNSADELYEALASNSEEEKIDLTLCFLDPDDRPYIREYVGLTTQLGTAYWQDEASKFLIMANATVVAPLEKNNACVYNFFQNFKFAKVSFEEQDAKTWVNNNRPTVRSWTNCNPR